MIRDDPIPISLPLPSPSPDFLPYSHSRSFFTLCRLKHIRPFVFPVRSACSASHHPARPTVILLLPAYGTASSLPDASSTSLLTVLTSTFTIPPFPPKPPPPQTRVRRQPPPQNWNAVPPQLPAPSLYACLGPRFPSTRLASYDFLTLLAQSYRTCYTSASILSSNPLSSTAASALQHATTSGCARFHARPSLATIPTVAHHHTC